MDLQTDPVAETVGELRPVAGRGDQVAGRCIHLAARRTDHRGLAAGPLGRRHDRVDLHLPVRRPTEHERPGHVRVVPVYGRTEVEFEQVARAQRS